MELLKLLSANEIIAQIACFLILLAILRVFLWDRFLKVLDDRRERISSETKAIEAAKSDMERLRATYEGKVSIIEEEARARIQEAINEGRRIADEIKSKAEAQGERILDNAKENIRIELAKAREGLKDEIVDLVIEVAEKVLEEKLSGTEEKKFVEDFLERIDKA